jgi:FkbM family methyltransferase
VRIDQRVAALLIRAGRRWLRNSPVQRLEIVTWAYRLLFGRLHPPGTDLQVRYLGADYVVPSGDITVVPSLTAGDYERAEFEALDRALRPGMVVVDVGANVGLHSVFFAARVGPAGKVIALEPEPDNYRYLTDNVRRNGLTNVDAVLAGAGAREAAMTLNLLPGGMGGHSFAPVDGGTPIEVRVVRLDDFLPQRTARVDLVKIDVEGFEVQVVAGLMETLARDRPTLLIEFSPQLLRRNGDDPEALLATLQSLYNDIQLFQDADRQAIPLAAPAARALLGVTSGSRNLLCTFRSPSS